MCLLVSVRQPREAQRKPLSKHFKQWVEKQHGRKSKTLSASSHVPAWALEALSTANLSDDQQQQFVVSAAKGGQLETVQWAIVQGVPMQRRISNAAAAGGRPRAEDAAVAEEAGVPMGSFYLQFCC